MNPQSPILRAAATAALLTCLPGPAATQTLSDPIALMGTEDQGVDLTDLSLEELMNIEVTVASRTKQKLSDVPAAVYVLTGDEIRRAGFSSVQEALRMVPGFQVSHWTNNMWDVTARGYGNGTSLTNSAFLNQLLVMIDGVPVYSPQFAGVWWALQDVDLADIDRIEVIRGPGGIIWGANAEHGVVHIITKNAADTQGAQFNTFQGNEDRHVSARGGVPFGETGHLRVWGKISTYDTPAAPLWGYKQDWTLNTGGFRADWGDPEAWQYNVWARAYNGRFRNIGFDLVFFQPFSTLNEKFGGQFS
ncbi:MAG TPA: hypothetical protein ENJ09_14445, partial [Planctomycetes bacterium]|nr:hypothetical protein [Planctomycetota bacterium]